MKQNLIFISFKQKQSFYLDFWSEIWAGHVFDGTFGEQSTRTIQNGVNVMKTWHKYHLFLSQRREFGVKWALRSWNAPKNRLFSFDIWVEFDPFFYGVRRTPQLTLWQSIKITDCTAPHWTNDIWIHEARESDSAAVTDRARMDQILTLPLQQTASVSEQQPFTAPPHQTKPFWVHMNITNTTRMWNRKQTPTLPDKWLLMTSHDAFKSFYTYQFLGLKLQLVHECVQCDKKSLAVWVSMLCK